MPVVYTGPLLGDKFANGFWLDGVVCGYASPKQAKTKPKQTVVTTMLLLIDN
jgi:hypothetical protein